MVRHFFFACVGKRFGLLVKNNPQMDDDRACKNVCTGFTHSTAKADCINACQQNYANQVSQKFAPTLPSTNGGSGVAVISTGNVQLFHTS